MADRGDHLHEVVESRLGHRGPFEYEYEYRCTEYEYDVPDERRFMGPADFESDGISGGSARVVQWL